MSIDHEKAIKSIDGCPCGDGWIMTDLTIEHGHAFRIWQGPGCKIVATFRWTEKDREVVFTANLSAQEWEKVLSQYD